MSDRTALADRVRVDVLLDEADRRAALHDETARGLHGTPKQVPALWLYDERGSQLFDEITRLPEYYLARCESEILDEHSAEIASLTRAETLMELGSGTSEKTRRLVDALSAEGTLRRFVPFDASEEVLVESAYEIAEEYPAIAVHAVVGDFERHVGVVPDDDCRLVAFLGSTIGNLTEKARRRFLRAVATSLGSDDALLLGLDLVKDPSRILPAYADSRGLTEAFVRNALAAVDRELGSGFSRGRWEYRPFWDAENEWVDVGFDSAGAQVVAVPKLGLYVAFVDGERLRVAVSAKFRRDRVQPEVEAAGFALERWWMDASCDFAVALATRA
jgi:L-histidine Nalpha-methyltransferase